jgi:hypothetical protein
MRKVKDMTQDQLQKSLVEHQKRKDDLLNRMTEIQKESQELQKEYNEVVQSGQMIEGGILLLDALIQQEKDEYTTVDTEATIIE